MIDDPVTRHQLETTDGTFTHGFELGYVVAKCESRTAFRCDVLSSQVEVLCGLLAKAGASVRLGVPETRRYTVSWTPLEVSFP